MLLSVVKSTVTEGSLPEGRGDEAVRGIIPRPVSPEGDGSEWEDIESRGAEEISLKKGHRDFVTILPVRLRNGTNRVPGGLDDRKKETVRKFFRSIPRELRKTVRVFCTDGYEGFVKAAKEFGGQKVRRVADRFHVAKRYRNGWDDLRKKARRRLKKALPKEEYPPFQTVMGVRRKHVDDRTPADGEVIEKLTSHAPRPVIADP